MLSSRRATPAPTVRGLAEDIDPPEARDPIEPPGLVRLRERPRVDVRERDGPTLDDRVQLHTRERKRLDELAEPRTRDRDLEVFVLAMLPAEEEIDRPPRSDVPGASTPPSTNCARSGGQASHSYRSGSMSIRRRRADRRSARRR